MVQVLQAAAVFLRTRVRSGDDKDGGSRDMRVGDPRHGVCHPRARGHESDAELARDFSMRLGHVHCRPFIAHVDDADAVGVKAHPDRHDVPAAEGKDALDATLLQKPRHEIGNAIWYYFHRPTPIFVGSSLTCLKHRAQELSGSQHWATGGNPGICWPFHSAPHHCCEPPGMILKAVRLSKAVRT